QLARLLRTVAARRCAGFFVQRAGRVPGTRRPLAAGGALGLAAEHGDDTHHALYRGTCCHLELRQGPAENFRPELYVMPDADIAEPLQRRIAALHSVFPGVAAEAMGREWRVRISESLRIGHEAAFR